MNRAALASRFKNLIVRFEIGLNRTLGRQFIPADRSLFHIETSSACNLKCRFCAYTKKASPAVSMTYERFADCVSQAVDLGYRRFELTPCTGDVFTDRTVLRKLDFLERHSQVDAYRFFTNFTIPRPDIVQRLCSLKKLEHMTASVYGHDRDSFVAITGGTLRIGDVNSSSLAEIVSADNPRYIEIIEQQQRGEFAAVCRSCDFYKSIYHHRAHYRRDRIATVTLEQFKQQLRAARPPQRGWSPIPWTIPVCEP